MNLIYTVLTSKAPITTIVAFVDSVDQDQAAQNVQPDLGSKLSALEKSSVDKSNSESAIIWVIFLG